MHQACVKGAIPEFYATRKRAISWGTKNIPVFDSCQFKKSLTLKAERKTGIRKAVLLENVFQNALIGQINFHIINAKKEVWSQGFVALEMDCNTYLCLLKFTYVV